MRDDGGMNRDEDGGVRKMSGCGAGCGVVILAVLPPLMILESP